MQADLFRLGEDLSRGKLGRGRISLGRAGAVPISGVKLAHSGPNTQHCTVIPDFAGLDTTDDPADQTSDRGEFTQLCAIAQPRNSGPGRHAD